jgi:gas vesicle protein
MSGKVVEGEDNGICKMTNFKKNWIIGILIGVIVLLTAALVTSISVNSPIVINYLSNAAQLISIVLAIIAIVYAFTQANQSVNQYNIMNKTLQDITNEIVRLQKVKDETISATVLSDEITNEISNMIDKIKESSSTGSNETKEELKALSDEIEKLRKENSLRKRQMDNLLAKGYPSSRTSAIRKSQISIIKPSVPSAGLQRGKGIR